MAAKLLWHKQICDPIWSLEWNYYYNKKRFQLCAHKTFMGWVSYHYSDVIMSAMASQITSVTIVYSIVGSGADQRKHQSSTSLVFVRGIHRWPGKFPTQRASNAEIVSIWWRHHTQITYYSSCWCIFVRDLEVLRRSRFWLRNFPGIDCVVSALLRNVTTSSRYAIGSTRKIRRLSLMVWHHTIVFLWHMFSAWRMVCGHINGHCWWYD